ncbi:hypothetical protein DXA97_10465 [Clostridium sp. OF09-36]|nr:hypothetical protein DW922_01225 [Clostridium sp. AM42-4]RHV87249.1 hypothetical protein DXA97_10465 [Clostridium sp. OF09-36]HBM47751.1 hypothetical protein [Lachnoclostridium sp.]
MYCRSGKPACACSQVQHCKRNFWQAHMASLNSCA